jgi:hypothetical protein
VTWRKFGYRHSIVFVNGHLFYYQSEHNTFSILYSYSKRLVRSDNTNRCQWRTFHFEDPQILGITVQTFAAWAIGLYGFVLSCHTTFLVLTYCSFCCKYIIEVFHSPRYCTAVCKNCVMNILWSYETSVAINRFSEAEYSIFLQPRRVTVLRNVAVGSIVLREIRVGGGGGVIFFVLTCI